MKNYIKIAKKCIIENKKLINKKLVIHNFGNVSIRIDKDHFLIKPSGAELSKLKPTDILFILINFL